MIVSGYMACRCTGDRVLVGPFLVTRHGEGEHAVVNLRGDLSDFDVHREAAEALGEAGAGA